MYMHTKFFHKNFLFQLFLLEKSIARVPPWLPDTLAAQRRVQAVIIVLRIVDKILDAVSVNFDGSCDLVHEAGAARVEVNAWKHEITGKKKRIKKIKLNCKNSLKKSK